MNQLQLFSQCLYEPGDIVEVRMLQIEPRHATSLWMNADALHQATELARWNKTHDIYSGANPRKAVGFKNSRGVELARCLFAEWDGLGISQVALRLDSHGLPLPTCVVWSGGGVHVYWRLESPVIDLELWRDCQKRLIALLDSDRCIHDPARIMRLPGYFNHKPGRTHSWLVYADPLQRVRLADLIECCPPVPTLPTCHRSCYVMPTDRAFLQKRAAAYLRRVPGAIAGNHGHNQTYRAAAILVKFGLSEDEAMPVLEEFNQRCDPPWMEKDLRRKYREAFKNRDLTRIPA